MTRDYKVSYAKACEEYHEDWWTRPLIGNMHLSEFSLILTAILLTISMVSLNWDYVLGLRP